MGTAEQLTPELLVAAYGSGYFPMADVRKARRGRVAPIGWYSPHPRAILPLADGGLHVSRSLARTIRRGAFELTTDTAFELVMRECAAPREGEGRGGAWISEEMIGAYTALHRLGFAHSVEAWILSDGVRALVGGIYGVSIGAAFFAESMFCLPAKGGTDASKVCLVELVRRLRSGGFRILDVQMANAHTERFGVVEVTRDWFLAELAQAVRSGANWLPDGGCPNGRQAANGLHQD